MKKIVLTQRRQGAETQESLAEITLTRMGDFYEAFGDDAVRIAACLELVVTSRGGKGEPLQPMCGFPYHRLASYLPRLTARYRVTLTTDP